jgi:FAD:protein FMN transferase
VSEDGFVRLACPAMGTRFEILAYGEDKVRLRAAAEEALREIERLERQLSAFRSDSMISRINACAAREPVLVEPGLFRLLTQCRELWRETRGYFDITVGPLMHCWGFREPRDHPPSAEEIGEARAKIGMQHVDLDEANRTVTFARPGLRLDLGAIGKGWALDEAAEFLREAGINSALIHGGTSTALAIGAPPGQEGWKIAVRPPPAPSGERRGGKETFQEVFLRDNSLSVSALSGRTVAGGGQTWGHVLDPLLGAPVHHTVLAAVVDESATRADALSTAFLAGGMGLRAAGLAGTRPAPLGFLFPQSPSSECPFHPVGLA